jgi:hypothetical protein
MPGRFPSLQTLVNPDSRVLSEVFHNMEKSKKTNKPDNQDINNKKITTGSEIPSENEPRDNNICTKDNDPYARPIAIIALVTSIIAVFFTWWQVDIAKDTAKRQLRAYVVPGNMVFKNVQVGSPISIKLNVYNMGQSPAYNVSQACIFRVSKEPYNYPTAKFKKDSSHGIAIIGKESIHFDNVDTNISDRDIGLILSKDIKLFYYAIVRYTDIFKQGHVLHVCSEYSVESNSFMSMPDCNYEE